jgi:hypothetical protein
VAWDVLDSEHTPKVGPLGLADGLLQSLPTALTTGKARAFGGKGGALGYSSALQAMPPAVGAFREPGTKRWYGSKGGSFK